MVDSTNLPEVDINQIATDLNGKMDRDCLNASDTGNIQMAKASMPSNTYIDLTLNASGSTYTAPADGWYFLSTNARSSSTPAFIILYSNNYFVTSTADISVNWETAALIPVRKGGNVTVVYGTTDANYTHFRFFYAVGSESEAS